MVDPSPAPAERPVEAPRRRATRAPPGGRVVDAAAPPPCCAIGARNDAAAIDADLRAGVALRAIERTHAVPYTPLRRHRGHVLPEHARNEAERRRNGGGTAATQGSQPNQPGAQPRQSGALQPPEAAANVGQPAARTVLAGARTVRRRASQLLRAVERGEQGVDFRAAASLLGQIRGAIELEARILGEIRATSAAVNVYQSPDWQRLRDLLIATLEPFPDALDAVDAAIAAELRGEAPPSPAAASVAAAVLARRDASFAATWEGVRLVLDARFPGAVEAVEAELAMWEEQGDDAWRARWGASGANVIRVVYPAGVAPLPGSPDHPPSAPT